MAEIFLMEDSAPLRRVLTEELRDAGHNVTALEDGLESRDVEFLDRADILVTDIDMPNVNGYEVVKNVRASHPSLPVLVITGLPFEAFKDISCDQVISKPIRCALLVDTIEAHLTRSIA